MVRRRLVSVCLEGGRGHVVVVVPDMQPITLEIPRAFMDSTMFLVPSDIMVVGPGKTPARQGALRPYGRVMVMRYNTDRGNVLP